MDSAFEAAREILRAKNVAQLGNARFHLYHSHLPTIPITQLPASPVFGTRPTVGQLPDYETSIAWETWSEEARQRASNLYANARFTGAGEHITVLMGSPGSGKTTVLKRLLLHLQGKGMTCVFVPLSIYNTPGPANLFDAVKVYYIEKLALKLPIAIEQLLEREIERKRLVLFLDSLDEADVPHRAKIVSHANDLGGVGNGMSGMRVPIFFSSRYIPLRLDKEASMTGAFHLHLAGLRPEQALAHIEILREHLESRDGDVDSSVMISVSNHGRRMRKLGHHLKSVMSAYEGIADTRTSVERDSSSPGRRATRTLYGLSYPLFLHLHIALCLERGVAEWSIDSIIGRYVEFLLGKWIDSRTENPEQEQHEEGRANLERALAYLAFHLTLREHIGESGPTPDEVELLLIEYFKKMALARKTDAQLSEFVRDQLQRARTAEIFEADSSSYLRFGAPADVLREYYVSQFIEQSTTAEESSMYPGRRPARSFDNFGPMKVAAYSSFLTNPSLRFLEPAMVLYFKSQFENPRVAHAQVFSRFHRAMITPPLKPGLTGCTAEELKKIVPLNLMFLGRAIEGDVAEEFTVLYEDLHRELDAIFDKTNFATVYDALLPIVRPLQSGNDYKLDTDKLDPTNPDDVERMDQAWRRLPTASRLMRLAERVQPIDDLVWGSLVHRQQVLLRRIVYQLRYHTATFDDTVLEWLRRLHIRCQGFGVADTVLTTARVIRYTMPPQFHFDWGYFEDEENDYKVSVENCKRALLQTLEAAGGSTDKFIKTIASDGEKFPFRAMQRASTDLGRVIARPEFDHEDAVFAAIRLLDCNPNIEQQGKTLLILQHIARLFRGQQVLLPREYCLDWIACPHPALRYSAEELMQRLFAVVKPHLEVARLEEDATGAERSALGGLQLYDFAVDTIWAILWNSPYAYDSREEM